MTFSLTSPDVFCAQMLITFLSLLYLTFTTNRGLGSLLSFFFFFFNVIYCFLSSLYSSFIYFFFLIFWFPMTFNFFFSFVYLPCTHQFPFVFFSSQGVFLDFLSNQDRYELLHFFSYLIFIFFNSALPRIFLLYIFLNSFSLNIHTIVLFLLSISYFLQTHSVPLTLTHCLCFLPSLHLCFGLWWSVAKALYPCLFFAFKFSVSSVHYSTSNFYYQLFFQLLVFNELQGIIV